jgi:hypothetical protein
MNYHKEIKKTSTPDKCTFSLLVNPVLKAIVFNTNTVYKSFFKEVPIGDILKHEQIHWSV